MEISGKIIAALPARSGVSQRSGNSWKSQEFVIETQEQYPRKCVFTVFGEDKLTQFNLQVGDQATVSFDIDAHEWQGRYFNDIRAWRVVKGDAQQPAPQAPNAATSQPAAPVQNEADDLPF